MNSSIESEQQTNTWSAWSSGACGTTSNVDSLFSATTATNLSTNGNMLRVSQHQHQQGIPHSMGNLAQAQATVMNGSVYDLTDATSAISHHQQYNVDKPNGQSNTPPSPADSGVLSDSKSDGGGVGNGQVEQMFGGVIDQQQHVANGYDVKMYKSQQSSTYPSQSISQLQSIQEKKVKESSLNGLFDPSYGSQLDQNIASIWNNNPSDQLTKTDDNDIHRLMAQMTLQDKQLAAASINSGNFPPGLNRSNGFSLQRSMEPSSNMRGLGASGALARSTSFQPAPNPLGLPDGNINANLDLGFDRQLSEYNWNGSNSMQHAKLASLINLPSNNLNNQQQLQAQANLSRAFNSNHFGATPRFARSISTPTNYNGFGNGFSNGMPPLDDVPASFYKTPDRCLSTVAQEHTANDRADFQVFYEMLRADTNASSAAMQRRTNPVAAAAAGNSASFLSSYLAATDNGNNAGFNASLYDNNGYGQDMQHLHHFSQQHQLLNRFRFSRKVFVGGLPPDIDEEQIKSSFVKFGALTVDWPHKNESKSFFPPKGYAFLIFQEDVAVWSLIGSCIKEGDKLFFRVSSPTLADKQVQIRPWKISDADFSFGSAETLDGRKTIFVGGVPRPLRAVELAMIMERLYGGVCYAGIDVDQDLKYPKGAGRVAFNNQRSYIAAISARYVQLKEGEINKRVEVKPYVVDDQLCDECNGTQSNRKFAPYFCANVTCLKYYCENCWNKQHSIMGRELHKPLTKDGSSERTPKSIRTSNNW